MKQKSREALSRAAGILDGLSFSVINKGGEHDAIVAAIKIINDVLNAEEERKEEDLP